MKVPPRIVFLFFAWEVRRECVLTIGKLMRTARTLVNDYYFCKKAAESCNHVLLWCPVVYNI